MKQTLNSRISKIDEVKLFRLMAELFNSSTSKSTFVQEAHGQKGYIDYNSKISGKRKKIEIADLLLITFNRKTNETRLCFIQAKYKRGNFRRFLNFQGNIYQWELLKEKPDIIDTYRLGYPTNILNFSTSYESITSFGIFYYDRSKQLDFLFTLPQHIHPNNLSPKSLASGHITMNFNVSCHCPNIACLKGRMPHETISTCSIDIFEQEALNCRIGAPIDPSLMPFLTNVLHSMRKNMNDNDEVINELMERLDIINSDYQDTSHYPNTIILLTDGTEINKNFG